MKNKLKNVFIDTSILSKIAWTKFKNNLEIKRTEWDSFITEVNLYSPNTLENNFLWITSNLLFLECIGHGDIKDKKQPKLDLFKHGVNKDEWKDYPNNPELFIQCIKDRIENFITKNLSQRFLSRQALEFTRKYHGHEHSYFIIAAIKRWGKNIKKNIFYETFKEEFFWDTLLKYPFVDLASIPPKDRHEAITFWIKIMAILYREYISIYKLYKTFEISAFGLLAEIHKIGSFYNNMTEHQKKGYDRILRQWDDMVDAQSIHYALLGKRKYLKNTEPVLVITGDDKERIKRRLECLYNNLIEIGQIPSKHGSNLDLTIDLYPGTIICVDVNKASLPVIEIINVQEFIEALNNSSNDVESKTEN